MNKKSVLALAALAVAFAMIASPLLTAMDANAGYSSSQSTTQKSTCTNPDPTSCRNIVIRSFDWGWIFR